MPLRVKLSQQAVKDLARIGSDRRRVVALLEALGEEPHPANLDVKPLRGPAPRSRARVGPYRVTFRRLTGEKARRLPGDRARGYVVARIVHRRELERIIARP